MDVEINKGDELRPLVEGAARPDVWVGDDADWEALSDLVTEDEPGRRVRTDAVGYVRR
jgi:hypothetical protein